MSLSIHDLRRAAELARIELAEPELPRLTREIGRILEQLDVLGELEAPDVAPIPFTLAGPGALRDDDGAAPDRLAVPPSALAPEWRDGFFLVPRLGFAEADGEERGA